jgi:hypothetical protein
LWDGEYAKKWLSCVGRVVVGGRRKVRDRLAFSRVVGAYINAKTCDFSIGWVAGAALLVQRHGIIFVEIQCVFNYIIVQNNAI